MAKKRVVPGAGVAPEPQREKLVGTDTSEIDSVGAQKSVEGVKNYTPPAIHTKPAPTESNRPLTVNTVTDNVDSAGTKIANEHAYVPGPRGPFNTHVKDSFRSE